MNEIFLLASYQMDSPLVTELRSMGARVHFRAEVGKIGITTILRGTEEWTPDFARRAEEVLTRHGLCELREGVWGPPETDAESLRRWEESARATEEYMDVYRTMTAHPDWTDQEIAEACGVLPDYVTGYREDWDL